MRTHFSLISVFPCRVYAVWEWSHTTWSLGESQPAKESHWKSFNIIPKLRTKASVVKILETIIHLEISTARVGVWYNLHATTKVFSISNAKGCYLGILFPFTPINLWWQHYMDVKVAIDKSYVKRSILWAYHIINFDVRYCGGDGKML